jgi:TolB-like protein/DNA-binding winged helix-turn-helix (wHTH) protein
MPGNFPSVGCVVDGAFRLQSWLIEPSLNTVSRNGTTVQLEPKVMAVLVCLAGHAPEPVSKEELLKKVWPGTFVGEGVLTRSIFELRRVFEDEAKEPRVIQTIAKRGYRLVAPVTPPDEVAGGIRSGEMTWTETSTRIQLGNRALRFGMPMGLGLAVVLLATLAFTPNKWWQRLRDTGGPEIRSIAVLPLQNLSGDPGQEYFSDAMTEELITELSRISALNVISRTSVMPYKDSKKSLPEIARELHADAIVEGSVLRSGDRVRITAQLIYAAKDTNVWAETYDRDVRDVLTLQSAVARSIAEEIRVQVKPQETAHWQAVRPVNRKALEAYLAGRDHIDRAGALEFHRGKEQAYDLEIQKAVEAFQRSVAEDSNYVPAYLGIFDIVNSAGVISHGDLIPAAREGIRKALEVDDSLVEAHLDKARLLMQWDYDYEAAGREYQRALELAPNSADVHAAYADYLGSLGRDDEYDRELVRAQELDPTHDRYVNGFPMNWTLDRDRQYLDESADRQQGDRGVDDPVFRATLGKGFQIRGRYKEAVEQYIKACELYGYLNEAEVLRRGYARGDYKGAIHHWMIEWEKRSQEQYVPPFWPAFLYANLGDRAAAFRWLEKAYREHSWCMLYLNDDKMWDPIRDDPRFKQYVRLAGLPEDTGQYLKQRELSAPQ